MKLLLDMVNIMNEHYKIAESLLKETIQKLSDIVESKGEDKDISCYGATDLNAPVRLLINATASMVMGRAINEGWAFQGTTTGRISSTEKNESTIPREEPKFLPGEIVMVSSTSNAWCARKFITTEYQFDIGRTYKCESGNTTTNWKYIRKLNETERGNAN